MKKILGTLLLATSFISCKSNEDKACDLIRNVMFETMYDYQSYEPISTTLIMTPCKAEYNKTCIDIAKQILKKRNTLDDKVNENYVELGAEAYIKADSIYANGLANNGYIVTQRYRCKNKAGIYNIYTSKYFMDEKIENIIWEYTFDENDEIQTILEQFIKKGVEITEKRFFFNNSKTIGEDFLNKNKTSSDIRTTSSGLQYKIITEGNGKKPLMNDIVGVHYHGKLLNDSTFICTYGIFPDVFKVGELPIKGLSEALTLMSEGAVWEVYIPQELGYKDKRKDKLCVIPPYSVLIFNIDLMIVGEEKMKKDMFWSRTLKSENKSWGLSE